MKYTAVLVALAAAIAAPLASANISGTGNVVDPLCSAASKLIAGNLTVQNTIKRTAVSGNSRIVQSILVKNNNAAATKVKLSNAWDTENSVIKATAKLPGQRLVTLSSSTSPITSGVLEIPSGKTLKATITYRAKRCPNPSPKDYNFGPAVVSLDAEAACNVKSNAAPTKVTVTKKKLGC